MCLGVPGQIVMLTREGELVRVGRVSYGGVDQEIN